MAKNYSAVEAAEVVMGNNKEEIVEVGSRYPLFARAVALVDNEHLLDILGAVPKVSARQIETGLKDADAEEELEAEQETVEAEKPAKPTKNKTEETEQNDYDSMTSAELYKEVSKRGLSSKVKDRKKSTLIAMLKADDAGAATEPEEVEEEEWEEEEEEKDPYAGKTAKELYKMCMDRGLKAQPRKKAEIYVKLLKEADAAGADEADEEDEDEWEI